MLRALALAAFAALAPLPSAAQTVPGPAANDYRDPANWLCRPGRADACRTGQDASVVTADGRVTRQAWRPAAAPALDCFYVYPTVSLDPTPNSDMVPGREERAVVDQQLNRFASQCRLFAPLYRQVTIPALRSGLAGKPMAGIDREVGYRDVRDAWRSYLANDNGGRGVVLIGHSQGSGILKRLMAEEIDGKPAQARLALAILAGTNLLVPAGRAVGGDLKAIPLCARRGQAGCVIAFVTFRADAPPPANSRFGRAAVPGMSVACVAPALAPGGAAAAISSYWSTRANSLSEQPAVDWVRGRTVPTPFVQTPGLVTAACEDRGGAQYLALTVHPHPAGPRTNAIPGDVVQGGRVLPDWGLHLVDINASMGDLVADVAAAGRTYAARQ